jgi:hypothetical protein
VVGTAATPSVRHSRWWALLVKRSIPLDIAQGVLIGWGVMILVIGVLITVRGQSMMTTVNGWRSTQACGVPSDWVTQSACAQTLPAINSPSEAMYWQATVDGTGAKLDGTRSYTIHFPKDAQPPVSAFWSITMAGSNRLMVANAAHRYSVSDHSGLVMNSDGSLDIYLEPTTPNGHEANWLPTPSGGFMLWLRAYEPGPAILDGTWRPPAVEAAR